MPGSALKLCVVAVVMCLSSSFAHAQKHDRNSYLGQTPPEIVSEADHWAGKPPPKLAELKGKVVWLHFNY